VTVEPKPLIELREITRDLAMEGFRECIDLSVAEHQKGFVASNMYSLAEALYESLGFRRTGEIADGEVVAVLEVSENA